ncbi:zinc finger TRAF-type-containing protein 1 homolog [Rhopalosiphum padi]|uniref:zinc finger TRAF-type-containing protein 1 homolog n=1 Tax=Rhopalosiphum padi TaxID=40932 RepID=UPI00298E4ED4|nr:zinc finger TRAF-type-containing protein 1 homolog [Rhopalosiphum padi]
MSDGEGSTQTAAVETGGQPDNITAAMDEQQQNVSITKDDGEPNPKKAKLSGSGGDVFGRGGGGGDKQHAASEKLEHRLGGILCCAVCLDLPRSSIYQCTNGHLMCAGCFAHLLADARLRDEMATCPNCRVDIAKNTATRNLAVEKAVSELPSECQFCAKEFPRNTLQHHEQQLCAERPVKCGYSKIGCPWRGPSHEASEHEKVCPHPSTTGKDVMSALDAMDQKFQEEKLLYDTIFDLMSFEKITFNDLQLKPYRTEEFVHKLYYETARFSAFNFQWVVKTRINNMQRDPALSVDRHMSYQLILKTKIPTPMSVHYLVVKGPFGDMKVNPKIYKFEFNENETETQFVTLPLPDSAECNRLLAAKTINLRLIMFLVSK